MSTDPVVHATADLAELVLAQKAGQPSRVLLGRDLAAGSRLSGGEAAATRLPCGRGAGLRDGPFLGWSSARVRRSARTHRGGTPASGRGRLAGGGPGNGGSRRVVLDAIPSGVRPRASQAEELLARTTRGSHHPSVGGGPALLDRCRPCGRGSGAEGHPIPGPGGSGTWPGVGPCAGPGFAADRLRPACRSPRRTADAPSLPGAAPAENPSRCPDGCRRAHAGPASGRAAILEPYPSGYELAVNSGDSGMAYLVATTAPRPSWPSASHVMPPGASGPS